MELTLNENFCEMSNNEMIEAEGGVAPAIIYAAGFVMGMSPAGALVVIGGAAVAGAALLLASNK